MYVYQFCFSQDRVAPTTPACLDITVSSVLGPWNSVTMQTICHQVLLLNPFVINLHGNTCLHVCSSCTLAYMFLWLSGMLTIILVHLLLLNSSSSLVHVGMLAYTYILAEWLVYHHELIISSVTSLSRNELHSILTKFPTHACSYI